MERHTTLDGRGTRYLEAGKGRPLVLLHAFPLSADMWRPQLASLPPGWRGIAQDLRGFGGTSRDVIDGEHLVAVPACGMDDYARDVLSLLDDLGIDRFVLGGLSMGGYVAFALWRLAAARIQGMLLADTRPEADSDQIRTGRGQMLELLEREGPRGIADAMLPRLLGAATCARRPDVVAEVRRIIETNRPDAIADAIRSLMTRPDSTPQLESITVPVRLVAGRDDELTPVLLHEQMHARVPGSTLTVIEGAGHLSNVEQPETFNQALSGFLSRLS